MKILNKPFIILIVLLLVICSYTSYSCEYINRKRVKNIILLIGDGMGVSQIYAGMTANHGHLNLERCQYTGFVKTYSSSDYVTESGAGATAMSTGKKTYNGACGVNTDSLPEKTILEIAAENGLATGLVATSAITHATPASFIAHQKWRNMYEEIAEDFLKTDIDVFIGGGREHFIKRSDSVNLILKLREKGYKIVFKMDSVIDVKSGKLAGLVADMHLPPYRDSTDIRRGDMLPDATQTAINILSRNKKGFFLMVEGSQIDWAGHANIKEYVAAEMIDFDRAIGKALDFAEKDGNTLVIITADHETGGMSINDGNFTDGTIIAGFNTGSHTGVMVPVFAYGPGSEEFSGIHENSDIFYKMMKAFGF